MINPGSAAERCYLAIANGIDTPAALHSLGHQHYVVDSLIAAGYVELRSGRYSIAKQLQRDSNDAFVQRHHVIEADMQRILTVLNSATQSLTQAEIQARLDNPISYSRFQSAVRCLQEKRLVSGAKSRKCPTGGHVFEYAIRQEQSA